MKMLSSGRENSQKFQCIGVLRTGTLHVPLGQALKRRATEVARQDRRKPQGGVGSEAEGKRGDIKHNEKYSSKGL